MHVSAFSLARVALARISAFLNSPADFVPNHRLSLPSVPVSVSVSNLTAKYPGAQTPTLQDVSLTIHAGSSVAIVGAVGSGKSTLLLILLRKLQSAQRHVEFGVGGNSVAPRLAYVPQEAFVLNVSLRENILFGEDAADLETAVTCSALLKDLSLFPRGLETEVGEHGVNLSGGQKQRLGLARALVRRPGLVLLDDPLSAVDEKTENFLARSLLFEHWKSITRVVVTHRLAHLRSFDRVVFLKDGIVEAQGTYSELWLQSEGFRAFCMSENNSHSTGKKHEEHSEENVNPAAENFFPALPALPEKDFTGREHNETGAVKDGLYWSYFKSLVAQECTRKPWILAGLVCTSKPFGKNVPALRC